MQRHKGALEILRCVPLQYEEEEEQDCHLYKPKVSPDWILLWEGGGKGQSQKYRKSHETEPKGGALRTREWVRHLSARYSLSS